MEVSHSNYNYKNSLQRIDEIFNSSDYDYQEHNGIPSRDNLTFKNGYYVDITVVFIDIRGSKELSSAHTRPVLAKIYRAYISEIIAVMKGDETINEIYIEGDGVWAVFNTTSNDEVNRVFETVARISSLIDILNIKLKRKKYSNIEVGIAIEDGESLFMKAGYKGSGINEVVWIGKCVGEAAKLSGYGSRDYDDKRLMISEKVHDMLNDKYQSYMQWSSKRECYQGNIYDEYMNKWVEKNESDWSILLEGVKKWD